MCSGFVRCIKCALRSSPVGAIKGYPIDVALTRMNLHKRFAGATVDVRLFCAPTVAVGLVGRAIAVAAARFTVQVRLQG